MQRVLHILGNLEGRINSYLDGAEQYRAKKEIAEQGILDMLCQLLYLLYLKTTPPIMFEKPFKSSKTQTELDEKNRVKLDEVRIEKYVAQAIAKENLDEVLMKIFCIVLLLVRRNRYTSEVCTKYVNIFYQHIEVQEKYFDLLNVYKHEFKAQDPQAFIELIYAIFRKVHKQAVYVHGDKSSIAQIECLIDPRNRHAGTYLAIDSSRANYII